MSHDYHRRKGLIMRMNKWLLICTVAILTGCGSSSGGGSSTPTSPAPTPTPTPTPPVVDPLDNGYPTVEISSTNYKGTIVKTGRFNVDLSSTNADIIIDNNSDLAVFRIRGINAKIKIKEGTTVSDKILIMGTNAKLTISASAVYTIQDEGVNTEIILASSG